MRRLLLVLCTSVLAVTSTAAAASEGTVVAEDPCGPAGFETTVPWQDLCGLSLTTVATDEVTELEVRLGVASTDRLTPSMFTVRWDVGGCAVRLLHGDETQDRSAISSISRMCEGDEAEADCAAGGDDSAVEVRCLDGRRHLPIDPPIVDGDAYVWRLTFEGELAEFAGDHAAGTELHVRTSTASPRVYETQDSTYDPACLAASCVVVGDLMASETAYRIN